MKILKNIQFLRALTSIEKVMLFLLLLMVKQELENKISMLLGYAHEAGKGVVIVYNKWDLVDKDEKTMQKKQKRNL